MAATKSIAEFEESILSSEAISTEAPSTADATTGHPAASGDTSFLSDFSQGGMGSVHTDEVDPIAEAEVYLAYGRDETAEEILKEAIVKNPQREELKVKLLEIYHQRNDVGAFETLAEEYYAQLGGRSSKLWEKVEEMGRKLNPENPMFRGGAPAKRAGDKPKTVTPGVTPSEFGKTLSDTQGGMQAPPAATQMVSAAPSGLDFDLGTEEATPAGGEAGFDFDLGQAQSPSTDFDFDTRKPAAGAGLNADMGLEALDLGQSADTGVAIDSGKRNADTGINWDMETATPAGAGETAIAEAPVSEEEGHSQQWDETATKLDLAKAYIDMGDAEGARSILGEVMAEGNDAQKKQAKELSAQIG
jgi:pilus assembly protein FimV